MRSQWYLLKNNLENNKWYNCVANVFYYTAYKIIDEILSYIYIYINTKIDLIH